MREAAKQPMVTLEELNGSTAQVGESVHRTIISHAFHKSDFYRREVRRKSLLKESHKKSHLQCGNLTVLINLKIPSQM